MLVKFTNHEMGRFLSKWKASSVRAIPRLRQISLPPPSGRSSLCTFASFHDLKKILVAIPTLTSFTLSNILWHRHGDTASSAMPSALIAPPLLSKLSVSGSYHGRQCADDVIIWLSTAPTRHLREFSFHLYHIFGALQLIADASLTTLDVQLDNTDKLLADAPWVARLEQLFSQVRDIEFLRLDVSMDTWEGVAGLLRLFGSVSSIHRLRLCSVSRPNLPKASDKPLFGASAKQLDPILTSSEDSAFCTLSTVEFAWYFGDSDDPLREQHVLLSEWVQRMLPQLHERHIVEVYAYKCDEFVFGPTGLAEHACGPDFPHAQWEA